MEVEGADNLRRRGQNTAHSPGSGGAMVPTTVSERDVQRITLRRHVECW